MFERNALTLQSAARGFLSRKKYALHNIPKAPEVDYEAFLVGNDPVMTGLANYQMTEHFALIGTSCFRSVAIACSLASKLDKTIIPKIVIIDSSRQVNEIWRRVQQLFTSCLNAETFQQQLTMLLIESAYLIRVVDKIFSPHPAIRYPNQNITKFFQYLFDTYDYDYVRRMILDTLILQHDWENTVVFTSLKNIFHDTDVNQIVAYPSNIVTSYSPQKNPDTIEKILRNIDLLKPALTIHTDLCTRHMKPEQALFFTESDPGSVNQQLFPNDSFLPCHASILKRSNTR